MDPTAPQQQSSVVIAVVIGLIALTCIAMAGTIFLIWDGVDAAQTAVVSGFAGTGLGALAAMLVSTRAVSANGTIVATPAPAPVVAPAPATDSPLV